MTDLAVEAQPARPAPRPTRNASVHEAAHATVAHACGFRSSLISLGRASTLGPSAVVAVCHVPEWQKLTWHQEVLFSVAGMVGEEVLWGSISIGGMGDVMRGTFAVQEHFRRASQYVTFDEVQQYLLEGFKIVRDYIRQVRESVHKLARAFQKKDLDEDEVAKLLADAGRLLLPDDIEAERLSEGELFVHYSRAWAPRLTGGKDPAPWPPPAAPAGGP